MAKSRPRGEQVRRVGFRWSERSYLTPEWYAERLGIPSKTLRGEDFSAGGQWEALGFYLREVVDCGRWSSDGGKPPIRYAAFYGPTIQKGEADDGCWSWKAPRRTEFHEPGLNRNPLAKYGTEVSARHVLGLLWRGRLCHLLGNGRAPFDPSTLGSWDADDAPIDLAPRLRATRPVAHLAVRLHARLTAPDCPVALRQLVLGPGHAAVTDVTPEDLILPQADHWWWLAASTDRVRALVIDLDRKEPKDEDHFQARLRALTCHGMPKPHLICTSRGGGRHLWYFVTDRADIGYNGTVRDATCFAKVFEDRLRTLGFWVGHRAVEVFPTSNSAKTAMPAFPFGPRSRLCNASGARPIAADPIDGINKWFHRCGGAVQRYYLDDFRRATLGALGDEDRELIAQPSPSLKLPANQTRPTTSSEEDDDDGAAPAPPSSARQKVQAKARRGVHAPPAHTLGAIHQLYDDRAQRGSTFDDIPLVARFLKFHLHPVPPRTKPNGGDFASFRHWIDPVIEPHVVDHSWAKYRSQFRSAFTGAQSPFAPDHTPSMTPADVRTVAEVVRLIARKDPRERASMFRVFAFVVGMARTTALTGSGWVTAQVPTKVLQGVWQSRYPKYLKRLVDAGVISLVKEGIHPTFSHGKVVAPGFVGEYEVQLPLPEGDPDRLGGPDELVPHLETWLGPEELASLFQGSKDWRALFKRDRAPRRQV